MFSVEINKLQHVNQGAEMPEISQTRRQDEQDYMREQIKVMDQVSSHTRIIADSNGTSKVVIKPLSPPNKKRSSQDYNFNQTLSFENDETNTIEGSPCPIKPGDNF